MKAATLILAREHLVDFCDFNISEVVFLCEVECFPIVMVLENMSDSERGCSMETEEKCDVYVSGEGMSRYTGQMYG